MVNYTNEISILHLSDLHFGSKHICSPEDPTASRDGIRNLGQLIIDDLKEEVCLKVEDNTDYSSHKEPPLIIAISGDFTQEASHNEFEDATAFLNQITSSQILNQHISKKDIFMVPGNHDVVFDRCSPEERFQPYCSFYNKFFQGTRPAQFPHEPLGLTQIHLVEKDGNKILIAEINCSIYVEKDTVDKSRGQVDISAIGKLRKELNNFQAKSDSNDYIKIALIHHHVVLLPSFIEPGRGVDAVMNARLLLELLSEFNFNLVLHGHKHYPQIFSYDPVSTWAEYEPRIPQLIIAGGSCGSDELPSSASNSTNTYSLITIKWHPAAYQARVSVLTRGLQRKGKTSSLSPDQWKWKTVNFSDKVIAPYQTWPNAGCSNLENLENDESRKKHYGVTRSTFPVVEVMPSLIPGQAYEARAWIVFHRPERNTEPNLSRVEWTAGSRFTKQVCNRNENPNFCISYHYWGPMLIQAKLIFEDGYEALSYVYARLPKQETT